jgi:CRP/FNR family cyclic AMP-dependent transcriptional regulator
MKKVTQIEIGRYRLGSSDSLGQNTLIEGMRTHPLLAGLSEAQLTGVRALATVGTFHSGEVVLHAETPSTTLYLIIGGNAVIELCMPSVTAEIQRLGPGDVFGWSALVGGTDTLFQVRASTELIAVRLDGARLLELCKSDTALGVKILHGLIQVVAGRVKASERRFQRLIGVGARPAGPSMHHRR